MAGGWGTESGGVGRDAGVLRRRECRRGRMREGVGGDEGKGVWASRERERKGGSSERERLEVWTSRCGARAGW